MDENDHRELSNRGVVSKDSTKPTTISTTTTIPTLAAVKKAVVVTTKSDPMIIPTSSPSINGNASPSPSKRIRLELVISTPKREDRKPSSSSSSSKFSVSSPTDYFLGSTFVEENTDDELDDGFADCGIIRSPDAAVKGRYARCSKEKGREEEEEGGGEKEDEDEKDVTIKADSPISRDGFLPLGDDKDGDEKEVDFEDRTFLSPLLRRLHDGTFGHHPDVERLQINAVLPERYTNPIGSGYVLVAQIFDRTKSAIFLQAFCQAFRLPETLSHLKRVKSEKKNHGGKTEVVLHVIVRDVPEDAISNENDGCVLSAIAQRYFAESLSALQTASEDSSSAAAAAPPDLCLHLSAIGDPYLARVSASPPLTRSQYEAARAFWPCTFHEDKRITSLIEGRFFSATESEVIRRNLALTLGVAAEAKKAFGTEGDCDACVIVDPRENEIIAVAHDLSQFEGDAKFHFRSSRDSDDSDAFKIRPYYHAPMVAIDLVAVSQGGGAYSIPLDEFPLMSSSATSSSSSTSPIMSGSSASTILKGDDDSNSSGGVTYLSTGYDVYLSKEPCLMCAMSLIHSRIRRLFYRHKASDGALGSKFSIHTLESLNHHFEAFCLE